MVAAACFTAARRGVFAAFLPANRLWPKKSLANVADAACSFLLSGAGRCVCNACFPLPLENERPKYETRIAQVGVRGHRAGGFATPGRADIYGTMSNFDVFNDTPYDAYGCELELEGIHSTDVYNTYPSHYDHRTVTEYDNGTTFGTRVTFSGYNFDPSGYIAPTVGQSTNGHTCVNTPGCEHFGFAVSAQPTATRYFWTDATGQRIGDMPMSVPTPSWNYIPPVGNGNAGSYVPRSSCRKRSTTFNGPTRFG